MDFSRNLFGTTVIPGLRLPFRVFILKCTVWDDHYKLIEVVSWCSIGVGIAAVSYLWEREKGLWLLILINLNSLPYKWEM